MLAYVDCLSQSKLPCNRPRSWPAKADLYLVRTDGMSCARETVRGLSDVEIIKLAKLWLCLKMQSLRKVLLLQHLDAFHSPVQAHNSIFLSGRQSRNGELCCCVWRLALTAYVICAYPKLSSHHVCFLCCCHTTSVIACLLAIQQLHALRCILQACCVCAVSWSSRS